MYDTERELIKLQAQARILELLEDYQLENNGDWLGAWIDIRSDIIRQIQQIKKTTSATPQR